MLSKTKIYFMPQLTDHSVQKVRTLIKHISLCKVVWSQVQDPSSSKPRRWHKSWPLPLKLPFTQIWDHPPPITARTKPPIKGVFIHLEALHKTRGGTSDGKNICLSSHPRLSCTHSARSPAPGLPRGQNLPPQQHQNPAAPRAAVLFTAEIYDL